MQLKQNETNKYYLSYYSLIGKSYFPFQISRVSTCCYGSVK